MSTPFDAVQRMGQLTDGDVQTLGDPADPEAPVHQWSQPEIDAFTLALAARRPLLIRGEPGTGKTQLASAAAQWLGWDLQPITIQARTDPQDLVCRFDAVKRLADAQARLGGLDEFDYWEPGPLWRAFDWAGACRYGSYRRRAGEAVPAGHVVLIDEIDKADSDLPNSLLEVLGQRELLLPMQATPVRVAAASQPLVVFTTNEERQLPAAFVRRCMVLSIAPAPQQAYADWLLARGEAHFGTQPGRPRRLASALMRRAAERLAKDRPPAEQAGAPVPGLAEYIDLLSALHAIAPGQPAAQDDWLRRLNAYAFIKASPTDAGPALSQGRAFDDASAGLAGPAAPGGTSV